MKIFITSRVKVFLNNKKDIYVLLEMQNYFLLKMFMRKLTMKRKEKGFNYSNKTSEETKSRQLFEI